MFDLNILKIHVAEMTEWASKCMPYSEIAKQMTPKEETKRWMKEVYQMKSTTSGRVDKIIERHDKVFQGIGKPSTVK